MLINQHGMCAICSGDNNGKRFHVDHNHKTGAIRALLCYPCNSLLGYAKEDEDVLRRAIDYLKEHSYAG